MLNFKLQVTGYSEQSGQVLSILVYLQLVIGDIAESGGCINTLDQVRILVNC